jgi:citrate lyase subunit beta / citryl-CoA lyase
MNKRSFLFVPGNRPARFDKACAAGADVVILDMEDAVAPADKSSAREAIKAWLGPDKNVYLRLNGAGTDWFAEDLELLGRPGVMGVVLPKAETAEQIDTIAAHSGKHMPIVPLIETALGLWHVERIAKADRVLLLAFGSIDFQLDTGIGGEGDELLMARSRLVLISRVAGLLPPVDGVTVALDDEEVLKSDVNRARLLGFGGKLCIHPKQVAAINAGFAPQPAELAWARQVIEAAENSQDNAVRLEGKLIDRPIIDRARALLASGNEMSEAR